MPESPTEKQLPTAKSARSADERRKIKAKIEELGLGGLANDTKWDELIREIRGWTDWKPSYRYNCVGCDYVSRWDVEWYYHLPFPMISVRWFEIGTLQEIPPTGGRYSPDSMRLPTMVSHLERITGRLTTIGFTFRVYHDVVRIFGYAPLDESHLPEPL